MTKISTKFNNVLSLLKQSDLTSTKIEQLAIETGFQKRKQRAVDMSSYTALLFSESVKNSPSCNDLAARLEFETEISVSKQAIWKKFNKQCVCFLKEILGQIISTKLSSDLKKWQNICRYRRIIVQDSTVIKLPIHLIESFSGVSNGKGRSCNARIQAAYDLLTGQFVYFSIDSYSKNDVKAAPELDIHEEDLVLRDRGYLTHNEIIRHIESEAFFIYRHKFNTKYIDPKTEEAINLLKLLKKEKTVDRTVLLNNKNKTKVRIVAFPVREDIANNRRRKLKTEQKGGEPSKEHLQTMSWTIFITNIPQEESSFDDLFDAYSLRWSIEIIFKSWKSNLNFANIHNVSKNQLIILITSRLAMIVLINKFLFNPLKLTIRKTYGKELSLIKFTKYVIKNIEIIGRIVTVNNKKKKEHIKPISKYCTYEDRERENLSEKIEKLIYHIS